MTYLINTGRGAWVRAARRDLDDLEWQVADAPPEMQDRLLEEIAQLRSEINERVCRDQQHVGWQ